MTNVFDRVRIVRRRVNIVMLLAFPAVHTTFARRMNLAVTLRVGRQQQQQQPRVRVLKKDYRGVIPARTFNRIAALGINV